MMDDNYKVAVMIVVAICITVIVVIAIIGLIFCFIVKQMANEAKEEAKKNG